MHIEESEQGEEFANKFGLFQIQLGGLEEVRTPQKFSIFHPHLSLEAVFPSLKLTQYLYKYEHLFFWKTGNLIMSWVNSSPFLSRKHTVPERLFSQSNKI